MDEQEFEVHVHGKYDVLPVCMEEGSVGYDIALPEEEGDLIMPYNSRRVVDTGVVIKPPMKCFELVVPRSSSRRKDFQISNTVGVIDPSYCGRDDTIMVDITRGSKTDSYVGSIDYHEEDLNLGQTIDRFMEREDLEEGVRPYLHVMQGHLENGLEPGVTLPIYKTTEPEYKIYEAGDRFCQVLFLPYYRPKLVEKKLEEFDTDNRGGFGSTG